MGLISNPTMKMVLFDLKILKKVAKLFFPSGTRVTFAGYANRNKIIGKVCKENGIISAWTDKIIHAEEKRNFNRQRVR